MRIRVRSLTKLGSSKGVKDVGREQGAKQFENIITEYQEPFKGTVGTPSVVSGRVDIASKSRKSGIAALM